MGLLRHRLLGAALVLAGVHSSSTQAQVAPGPTLAAVRSKGVVDCAASPGTPGFGAPDSRGVHRGLDPDTCRALAAAVFGDAAQVRFVPLSGPQRLPALQTGAVDVVAQNLTWSHARDTATGLNFAAVTFYDGQSFLVRRGSGIRGPESLSGASICVTSGSTNELNLADWARREGIAYSPVVFERADDELNAYLAGRCDSFTLDASQLAAMRPGLPDPDQHEVLPQRISKEPLGVAVRQGDDQWFDIVRWTIFALIEAEELGVTQANVDQAIRSENPAIRRLLGETGEHGVYLGLERRWAYNAIKAVGNYGEIYDRHFGPRTSIALPRGLNDLWTRGGLMIAPLIQ